ncbi:MAG: hypothetical protein QXT08_05150, partial [Thermoproteota archaeon]
KLHRTSTLKTSFIFNFYGGKSPCESWGMKAEKLIFFSLYLSLSAWLADLVGMGQAERDAC